MSGLGLLWRRHRLLLLAASLSLALLLFFAVRLVVATLYWTDPAHRDQAIAGWMTPRYIAHSWHVPPEVVGEALGVVPGRDGHPPTLDSIAAERGTDVATLAAEVEAAIDAHRDATR